MSSEDNAEDPDQPGTRTSTSQECRSNDSPVGESEDVPVWKIVKLHKRGESKKEILRQFPGLSEEKVTLAISSYYCNRRTIESKIKQHEN